MELSNHHRKAIAGSYKNLKAAYKRSIEQSFEEGEGTLLAKQILDLFLGRQIAIDIYFNFICRDRSPALSESSKIF